MPSPNPQPETPGAPQRDLAYRLLELRNGAEWTQDQLAEQLKTTKGSVSGWENGKRIPDPGHIDGYATLFGDDQDGRQALLDELTQLRATALTRRTRRGQVRRRRSADEKTAETAAEGGNTRTQRRGAGGDGSPPTVPENPPSAADNRGWRPSRAGAGAGAVVIGLSVLAVILWVAGVFGSGPKLWHPPAHAGKGVTLTVDSRSAIGPREALDVGAPLRLATQPYASCVGSCLVSNSVRHTGDTYRHAVCETTAQTETNGNLSVAGTTHNPHFAQSSRWYGIRLTDGTLGFVNAIWITAKQRARVRLPSCPYP